MKTILRFGYHDYLVPKGANVNTILAALGGMVRMEAHFHEGNYFYQEDRESDGEKVSVKVVDDKFVLDAKRKAIPAKCGPEGLGELLREQ